MVHGCPDYQTTCQISRRRLLQAGTAGIAGLSLPALLKAEQKPGSRHKPSTSSSCTSLVGHRISIHSI